MKNLSGAKNACRALAHQPFQRRSGTMDAPHHLQRFVDAQQGVHGTALAELKRGRKTTHWMWFVFPQFAGLGLSEMSRRYAIASREEARAYLDHPVLGARLVEGVEAVNAVQGRSAHEIFGSPDDRKFQSCLTLFEQVASVPEVFAAALDKYYGGERDARTLQALERG
jgi:uncharacterized protein (DUF1810 family)